jgi:hypothetical protein
VPVQGCTLPLPNNTASETFLHKLGAVGNIDWIVYQWGAGLAVTGLIRDVGQNISHTSFEQEVTAATVTSAFSSLSLSSTKPLIEI